jgi:1-acyl-sn-glycerol-3-phosphate acyltransferase
MRIFSRSLQLLYVIYAFLTFLVLMLMVFPIVGIASFWGKLKGGNFIYRTCRVWADCWFFLIAVRHQNLLGSSRPAGKQYVFVANHISYMDIPVILKSVRKQKIRVLGKYEMKNIPIFGFIYRSATVMVDRSNPGGRSKSVRQLKSVLRKGVSIFIYPEGTFNETHRPLKDFYDGAFRIAIETGTPILPLLFLDTYDRMPYKGFLTLNPGKSRTVYLDEVPVEGLGIQDLGKLKEEVFRIMEENLIKFKASWIRTEYL